MYFVLICLVLITHSILNADAVVPNFYWREYVPGNIPCDALEAAPGRYIGQLLYSGYNLPATIYPENNLAVSAFDGKRTSKAYLRIFCTPDKSRFYWKYVDFNKPHEDQLEDVVKGGYETSVEPLINLYIGKRIHGDEWKVSKVIPYEFEKEKGLWLWDEDDKTVNVRQFYILKYNTTGSCTKHCHAGV